MCVSCGCLLPDNPHGDSRNISLTDLRCAAEAAGVSLQDAASNITKTIAACCKASRGEDAIGVALKADDEKQFLLCVAYPAYKPDVAVAADGHIDAASADVVEKAAWAFMRKSIRAGRSGSGMWHEPGNEDAAEVVESYIWRGDPWVIKATDGTEQKIMPGDWLIGLILKDKPWALYKAGLIGGVSPQGGARRRRPTAETIERIRSRLNG